MSNTMSKPGLDPIEHASIDELRALQLERLKWTLKHAYDNVPHYKKAFDEAGVHPDDLKQLSDISKFPFTTKKELRENYPFGMFAVPRERISRIHASSGTTGKPTVVGYTRATWITGPTWWRARSAPPAASRATPCTWPMATACSRAGWARTTAPNAWAAPSFPCPADRPKSRSS